MNFPVLRTWPERLALLVWSAVLLFVGVRVFLAPEAKTVYPIFSASARLWWQGSELYEPHRPKDVQDGYRYAPTCAIAFTPFAVFPDEIGGVLWRLASAAALLGALYWLTRAVLPELAHRHLAWLALLSLPMALQSVNNGQTNLVVVACMLGTIAAVAQERWNLASVLLAGAFVVKLYPLALGMILMALYPRRLGWRIPLLAAASLAIPFLCQRPDYVLDQYEKWIVLLSHDNRADIVLEHMYRDLWLLIYLYDLPISRGVYLLIQAAGGALVALECWRRQRAGWPTSALLISTLALTTAWMMLLGPATESSSFVLLAPSFALSVLQALTQPQPGIRRALLWVSCVCFAAAIVLGGFMLTLKIHFLGVHAWGSLFYLAYLLTERRPDIAQAKQQAPRLAA